MNNKFGKYISILALLVILGITAFQSFQNLGKEHIKIWDEARGANNAIEMLQNKDYIVVHFDGQPDEWNSKTAFFIWFKVLSFKVFGINEFAVRFPTAIFTLLTTLLVLLFSWKFLHTIWPGALAVVIMVNTPGYMGYHVARNGEPDTMLVFFVLFYALAWFLLLDKYPLKRNLYYALFGLGLALAVYTKNIAGVAPLLGIAVYTLVRYKLFFKVIKDFRTYIAIFSAFALVVLYFILREQNHPGYADLVVKREITGMFFDYVCGDPKHPEFIFYLKYLYTFAFKYYIYLLPLGVFAYFTTQNETRKWFIVFCFIMSLSLILGYSMAEAKNEWYIAPVYTYFAFISGIGLYELIILTLRKINQKYLKYTIFIVLSLAIALLSFDRGKYVYKKNQPWSKIYGPERPGYYLKKYKEKHPDIKEFFIITSQNPNPDLPDLDQVKFYAKKYKIQDNTRVIITDTLTKNLSGHHVITCEEKYMKKMEMNFNYKAIERDKSGVLFFVEHKK